MISVESRESNHTQSRVDPCKVNEVRIGAGSILGVTKHLHWWWFWGLLFLFTVYWHLHITLEIHVNSSFIPFFFLFWRQLFFQAVICEVGVPACSPRLDFKALLLSSHLPSPGSCLSVQFPGVWKIENLC